MDFKSLNVFRMASRLGSFSKAADFLACAQSRVTTQVKGLEETLNVRLFERHGRGVTLTAAGKQLLRYADQLFAIRDEAVQVLSASNEVEGEVTIAGYETILTYRVPSVIREFSSRYPKVKLNVIPAAVSELKPLLLQSKIDIAYVLEEEFSVPELDVIALQAEEVVVVASPENPLSKRETVSAADVINQTVLFTESGCNYRNRFERCLIRAGSYSKAHMEFMSIETIKACVKLGVGIAAISKISVADEIAMGNLVALNWVDDELDVSMQLAWNKNRWLSPAVKAFIDLNKKGLVDQAS